MSKLDTPTRLMPRSAVRYRPLGDGDARTDGDPPGALPITPIVKRASRLRQPDIEEVVPDDAAPPAPKRAPRPGKRPVRSRPRHSIHPLLYLGVGMVVTVSILAVVIIVSSWVSTVLDDLHYGRPRTFQIDAYVGHHEAPGMPSHFIALNLRGHFEVIEFPGGDVTHARIYLGPQLYGPNADLVPVTLSFTDVHGDHRPDMILHFQGTQAVFLNDGTSFRPAGPVQQQGSP